MPACTLKGILQCYDLQLLLTVVTKFFSRFDKLSASSTRPKLASALYQFGWSTGTATIAVAGQIIYDMANELQFKLQQRVGGER